MFRWYAVNTYSGHEKKVKQNLEHRVQTLGQQTAVRQVVIPTEQVPGDEGRPEGHEGAAHDAGLPAREHEPHRRLLGAREEHARASPASWAHRRSPCP